MPWYMMIEEEKCFKIWIWEQKPKSEKLNFEIMFREEEEIEIRNFKIKNEKSQRQNI